MNIPELSLYNGLHWEPNGSQWEFHCSFKGL